MNVDLNFIRLTSEQLLDLMDAKYPGVKESGDYTFFINIWADDTYQIICKSGAENCSHIREFIWYDGLITYAETTNSGEVLLVKSHE